MLPKTVDRIAVMQAWFDKKEVRFNLRTRPTDPLLELRHDNEPEWNWTMYNYVIVHKPPITTKRVMFGWLDNGGEFHLTSSYSLVSCRNLGWKRVPSEDKTLEVVE